MFLYGENGAYDYMFAAVGALVAVACLTDLAVLAFTDHVLRWQDRMREQV
jgi:NitT/TauT family transport system permease protein